MRSIKLTTCILSLLMAVAVWAISLVPVSRGHDPQVNSVRDDLRSSLIQEMVGTWDVQERMWSAPGVQAADLPAAVAHRRLIGGAFLEEVMDIAPKSNGQPFTRIAFFNYNDVNQQFEYCSIDTRAAQMMTERSYESDVQRKMLTEGAITLYGGIFVAPRWGELKNAAFRYRLTIGEIRNNRQLIRLYLTPLSGESAKEFLAFEYIYTRQP
jgi:hypothetical protein